MIARRSWALRRGTTLIELMITLALLAIIASVATLAIRRVEEPPPEDPVRMLADTLRVVVATGHAATIRLVVEGKPALATILPDGSIVADSSVPIDRLSGAPRNAR